jgi:hypothetical protein
MCQHSISDNVGVASLFLFVLIYLLQASWFSTLFHFTPADYLGLDNINMNPRPGKDIT